MRLAGVVLSPIFPDTFAGLIENRKRVEHCIIQEAYYKAVSQSFSD